MLKINPRFSVLSNIIVQNQIVEKIILNAQNQTAGKTISKVSRFKLNGLKKPPRVQRRRYNKYLLKRIKNFINLFINQILIVPYLKSEDSKNLKIFYF